jgi:CheY-like chemotaxis protein
MTRRSSRRLRATGDAADLDHGVARRRQELHEGTLRGVGRPVGEGRSSGMMDLEAFDRSGRCRTVVRPAAGNRSTEERHMEADQQLLQVLVVEDDPGDVALVESAFAEHSIRSALHHVADGAEALAFLHRDEPYADAPRPDLILLDLNMPRVDGRQALVMIKTDDRFKSIPTIVFTTSSSDSDVTSSYNAQANAYVTKPINLDDYERVINAIHNFYGRIVTLPRRPADDPTA